MSRTLDRVRIRLKKHATSEVHNITEYVFTATQVTKKYIEVALAMLRGITLFNT